VQDHPIESVEKLTFSSLPAATLFYAIESLLDWSMLIMRARVGLSADNLAVWPSCDWKVKVHQEQLPSPPCD
jgi:hypothetical protein